MNDEMPLLNFVFKVVTITATSIREIKVFREVSNRNVDVLKGEKMLEKTKDMRKDPDPVCG